MGTVYHYGTTVAIKNTKNKRLYLEQVFHVSVLKQNTFGFRWLHNNKNTVLNITLDPPHITQNPTILPIDFQDKEAIWH